MLYKNINRCQISESLDLQLILSLGLIPPVNQMTPINQRPQKQIFFPTELYYSPISKLVQLGIAVDKIILFPKEYPYTSSTTKILRENFKELSDEVFERFRIKKDDLIIDIGSNDGNLLLNFLNKMRVLGVTPENIGKLAIEKGIPTILDYFTPDLSSKIIKNYGLAKIITATNVFAHIDDVGKILNSIYSLLKDDGVFITESHYLLSLIEENQYDTVYHEHLRYYSLSSLKYLFEKHNMEIIYAKKIDTHGGSIRVYSAKKDRHKIDKNFIELINYESKELYSKKINNFQSRVTQSKLEIYTLLNKIKNSQSRIYGISAPSRATTLANYIGLNSDIIDCILEIDGSKKIGYYLPGTNIPIYNEKKLYEDQPEYAFIFSWHIYNELIANLKNKGFKGKFIIPLPNPFVLS
jgi:SAM-dependent methyltransferase